MELSLEKTFDENALTKIIGLAQINIKGPHYILKSTLIDSPLGPMLAIGDEEELYLLEFIDRKGLKREIERLIVKTKSNIDFGRTSPIDQIEQELDEYFKGKRKEFKTKMNICGSTFQKEVWQELMNIPYGETRTYLQQARAIGKPTSFRAVANANGANQFAIIIPCHRVINTNGKLGGYGGGIEKKKWLLEHERSN